MDSSLGLKMDKMNLDLVVDDNEEAKTDTSDMDAQ